MLVQLDKLSWYQTAVSRQRIHSLDFSSKEFTHFFFHFVYQFHVLLAHTLTNRIRHATHVHKAHTNRKRDNYNAQNVQASPAVSGSQLDKALAQQPIAKNAVHQASIWIQKAACVAHAVTDSTNRMRDHSHACCAVSARQRVLPKQPLAKSVATNVHLANNWAAIHVANLAQEAHIVLKAFNQHAPHVRWVEPHQKWVLHRSKSARCQCVNRVHI